MMYSAKSSFFSRWTLSEDLLSDFSVLSDIAQSAHLYLGLTKTESNMSNPEHVENSKTPKVSVL